MGPTQWLTTVSARSPTPEQTRLYSLSGPENPNPKITSARANSDPKHVAGSHPLYSPLKTRQRPLTAAVGKPLTCEYHESSPRTQILRHIELTTGSSYHADSSKADDEHLAIDTGASPRTQTIPSTRGGLREDRDTYAENIDFVGACGQPRILRETADNEKFPPTARCRVRRM